MYRAVFYRVGANSLNIKTTTEISSEVGVPKPRFKERPNPGPERGPLLARKQISPSLRDARK